MTKHNTLLHYPKEWKEHDPNLTLIVVDDVDFETAKRDPQYINTNNFSNFIIGDIIDGDIVLETGEIVVAITSNDYTVYITYNGELKQLFTYDCNYEGLSVLYATLELKEYTIRKLDDKCFEDRADNTVYINQNDNNKIYFNLDNMIN